MASNKTPATLPDDWFLSLKPPVRRLAEEAREVLRATAPSLREEIKWGMPWYSKEEYVVCLMSTGKRVNLGFWRGVDLPDPKGLLEGSGKGMRHVKLPEVAAVRSVAVRQLIRAAVALDSAGKAPLTPKSPSPVRARSRKPSRR